MALAIHIDLHALLSIHTITHNYIYHIIYNASAKGYLHFTVLLWKVTLWFANSCFSVDTPVYIVVCIKVRRPSFPRLWNYRP